MRDKLRALSHNEKKILDIRRELFENAATNPSIFQHSTVFDQKLVNAFPSVDKTAFLCSIAEGQKVLHIGCCDWPIMNIPTGLHYQLVKKAREIVGVDSSAEDLAKMREFFKNLRFEEHVGAVVGEQFDVVLVPDVLEHVNSAQDFLASIRKIEAQYYILSVPNAFSYISSSKLKQGIEFVHEDHKCYYSPYTLYNTLTINGFDVIGLLGYDTRFRNVLYALGLSNPLKAHGVIAVCRQRVDGRP